RVLDPFAGVGGVHALGFDSVGVELEPEWATQHPRTLVANALALPFAPGTFDAVITSPAYGNRLADRDMRPSCAGTYAKWLGREASAGSACHLQWGDPYRAFHQAAWCEAVRVLRFGGRFVLNVSDHVRDKRRQAVTAWHVRTLLELGLAFRDCVAVITPRLRNGANAEARVPAELIVAFEKVAA
ncbi:MAG TPA: hypothetical protein VIK54_03085, partial [Acidimicrobiia bacterium]